MSQLAGVIDKQELHGWHQDNSTGSTGIPVPRHSIHGNQSRHKPHQTPHPTPPHPTFPIVFWCLLPIRFCSWLCWMPTALLLDVATCSYSLHTVSPLSRWVGRLWLMYCHFQRWIPVSVHIVLEFNIYPFPHQITYTVRVHAPNISSYN